MPHITLTDEQARVLRETTLAVELRDGQGRVLARLPPPTEEEIVARIKQDREANHPRYPSSEVQARLRRLEEIARERELDEATVRELLRRMRAGEEV